MLNKINTEISRMSKVANDIRSTYKMASTDEQQALLRLLSAALTAKAALIQMKIRLIKLEANKTRTDEQIACRQTLELMRTLAARR